MTYPNTGIVGSLVGLTYSMYGVGIRNFVSYGTTRRLYGLYQALLALLFLLWKTLFCQHVQTLYIFSREGIRGMMGRASRRAKCKRGNESACKSRRLVPTERTEDGRSSLRATTNLLVEDDVRNDL